MASISVSQSEANNVFKQNILEGEEKVYKDLIEILKKNFEGINDSQCSGLIHRAHKNEDGVLRKKGKVYTLRDQKEQINGISKVKEKIQKTLDEISTIPVSEFTTPEEFTELIEIQKNLKKIING
ncbi:hypothetical protein [Bacillus halotolerans]|uniref:hypothetical protein n=1 Tax=Bacillus halotolerans TaxID=260554 RepID=UPI002931DAFF|nr:hypothetical protein [Bacillus halotolerans]